MKTIEISDEAYELLATYHGDVKAYVEKLASEAEEVAAVREGMSAYETGDFEPWEDFSARFRAERGIKPER